MSDWNGPAFKGAMRAVRANKRAEAETRNAESRPEDRRQYRLDPAYRLLTDVFKDGDPK